MSPKREQTYDDLVELRIDDMIEEEHASDLGSSVEPKQEDFDLALERALQVNFDEE